MNPTEFDSQQSKDGTQPSGGESSHSGSGEGSHHKFTVIIVTTIWVVIWVVFWV